MAIQFLEDKKAFQLDKRDVHDVEIGDIKEKDFYPQAKVKSWDNDANFSLRYNKDIKDSKFELQDNTVVWKSAGEVEEVKMYEVVKTNELEEDVSEFEFEVTFNEKPQSRIIPYTIRTKNLNFFYQPELTKQEKDMGIIRPINVIGSYAVYHNSKRDNEYKTGKAFHIYRPYAVDSKGLQTWCNLNIDVEKNALYIELPLEFFEDAVYPVHLDPTLGYGVRGGTVSELLSGPFPCVGVLCNPAYPGRATNGSCYGYTPYGYPGANFNSQIWEAGTLVRVYGAVTDQSGSYGAEVQTIV
jgi:hypothetical protein